MLGVANPWSDVYFKNELKETPKPLLAPDVSHSRAGPAEESRVYDATPNENMCIDVARGQTHVLETVKIPNEKKCQTREV